MSNTSIEKGLNPIQVSIVQERLAEMGYTIYTLQKGNDCIWANCRNPNLNAYFIFNNDNQLIRTEID